MCLEGKGTLTDFAGVVRARLGAGRLVVFKDRLAINLYRHLVAFDGDFLGPPFVILRRSPSQVHDIVKAAGLFPVSVADVDLRFEALPGPAGVLILRVKINAAIGIRLRHHVHAKNEILERRWVADVIQMVGLAVSDERAVLDLPGIGAVGGGLPAFESLAVHDRGETLLGIIGEDVRGGGEEGHGRERCKRLYFHARNIMLRDSIRQAKKGADSGRAHA